jgi:hypothetical protein
MTPAELVDAAPLPFWLLVDALATYRLSRLLTRDSLPLVQAPRDAVLARWGHSSWSELAVCPWCISVWLGAGVVAARLLAPAAWTPVALVLAYSAVTGLLASHE